MPRREKHDDLPTRESFIKVVADLLEAAEAFVSGGVSIGPNMAPYSQARKDALQERYISLAFAYASLSQQAFVISRADAERGAAEMLGTQQAFDHYQ
ncbi:MAG: hypothetical protein H0T46_34865 [Deltaproteobacteria bacterium]|nr:hypothetical protein [Deltaproteobacteria bacterium]